MKKNLAAALMVIGLCAFGSKAMAGGVGYINYPKVQDNFAFAQGRCNSKGI